MIIIQDCHVLNPTVNKPRLSISSLDIIIKLKTMLTKSQILNLTALSAQTSWMFGFRQDMTSSLGNVNKPSGSQFSIIFFEYLLTLKTNHDMQVGLASGTCQVALGELFILKSTKPLSIIFKCEHQAGIENLSNSSHWLSSSSD